jgi:hypothetical protein
MAPQTREVSQGGWISLWIVALISLAAQLGLCRFFSFGASVPLSLDVSGKRPPLIGKAICRMVCALEHGAPLGRKGFAFDPLGFNQHGARVRRHAVLMVADYFQFGESDGRVLHFSS